MLWLPLRHALDPIVANGIDEIATRYDLIDRALIVKPKQIPDDKRKREKEFWKDFQSVQPSLLGALLDIVSGALMASPYTHLQSYPRMADFAQWVTAAESSLQWEEGSFVAAYQAARDEIVEASLEGSPVYEALVVVMNPISKWQGNANELLQALGNYVSQETRESDNWPKNPRGLRDWLNRLAPALRLSGLNLEFQRQPGGTRKRVIKIEKTEKFLSRPSRPSQTTGFAESGGDGPGTVQGRFRDGMPTENREKNAIGDDGDGRDGERPLLSDDGDQKPKSGHDDALETGVL